VKSATVALLLVSAAALTSAQQPNPGSATGVANQQFEDGTVLNGTYSNECLGFSFQVPAGWEIPYQQGTRLSQVIPRVRSICVLWRTN